MGSGREFWKDAEAGLVLLDHRAVVSTGLLIRKKQLSSAVNTPCWPKTDDPFQRSSSPLTAEVETTASSRVQSAID